MSKDSITVADIQYAKEMLSPMVVGNYYGFNVVYNPQDMYFTKVQNPDTWNDEEKERMKQQWMDDSVYVAATLRRVSDDDGFYRWELYDIEAFAWQDDADRYANDMAARFRTQELETVNVLVLKPDTIRRIKMVDVPAVSLEDERKAEQARFEAEYLGDLPQTASVPQA